jgi:hypothetical protein
LVSKDTAGTAIINAGENMSKVAFGIPYNVAPKVIVSVNGLPDFFYGVATKTPEGFSIITSKPMTATTTFDWVALMQPEDTNSTSSLDEALVVTASANDQALIINNNNESSDQMAPQSDSGFVAGDSTSTPESTTATPDTSSAQVSPDDASANSSNQAVFETPALGDSPDASASADSTPVIP